MKVSVWSGSLPETLNISLYPSDPLRLVCIKTLDKFAAVLSEAQRKDPKLIEAEFKTFCKTQKNKENRFVSESLLPRRPVVVRETTLTN